MKNLSKTLFLFLVTTSLASAADTSKIGPHGGTWVSDSTTRAEVVVEPSHRAVKVYLAHPTEKYPASIDVVFTQTNGKQLTVQLSALEPTPEFLGYHGNSIDKLPSYVGLEVRIPLKKMRTLRDKPAIAPLIKEGN